MGENSGLSASDVLALDHNNDNFMSNGSGIIWLIALMMMGGGNWGWGGNNQYVTNADLQASQNAQTSTLQFQNLNNAIESNKFDVVTALTNQNNANLVNAIQGFNNLGQQITNQTNALSAQMAQMSAHLDDCCCSIKTMMLQNRYEDERAKNVVLQNQIDNNQQTQTLLSQFGRFVPWAGSGSVGGAAAVSG